MQDFIDLRHDGGYFKIKDGMYMPKIRLVEELFDNPPFVMLYDELRHDPVRFLHKLALFMDTDFTLDSISFSPRHTSYAEKQLKVMQKFGRYLGVAIRPLPEDKRVKRFFLRLWHMLPRYTVLHLAWIVPNFLLPNEPLTPGNYLEEIRRFYEEDWNETKKYAQKIQDFHLNKMVQ